MAVVKVDGSNPANFESRASVIDKGRYVFEIANDLAVIKSKSSDNNIIKVELRCQDEGKFKGAVVFDNIALTKKAEFKLVHLALAAGSQSKDDITSNGVDLALLKGCTVEVEVDVEAPSTGADGKTYGEKNRVVKYVFDPNK